MILNKAKEQMKKITVTWNSVKIESSERGVLFSDSYKDLLSAILTKKVKFFRTVYIIKEVTNHLEEGTGLILHQALVD